MGWGKDTGGGTGVEGRMRLLWDSVLPAREGSGESGERRGVW